MMTRSDVVAHSRGVQWKPKILNNALIGPLVQYNIIMKRKTIKMRNGTWHNMNIICDFKSNTQFWLRRKVYLPVVYRQVCGQKYIIQVPKKTVVNDSCSTHKYIVIYITAANASQHNKSWHVTKVQLFFFLRGASSVIIITIINKYNSRQIWYRLVGGSIVFDNPRFLYLK